MLSVNRLSCKLLIPFATLVLSSASLRAGEKVVVGRSAAPAERVSADQVDHRVWDGLLKEFVDTHGKVDYRGWKRSSGDLAALDRYLNELSRCDPRLQASRAGSLAFWINAYNAVTIRGILREYPTSSIRNHTARFYGYNIWHDLLLVVGGSRISLHDIEHEVLRKSGEPRIHFAIVCASHSCPKLLDEAYTGQKLEEQLTANTRQFFGNPENFRFHNGTFYLSPVLKWFRDDFGSDPSAVLRSIAPYLPELRSQQAATDGQGRITYLKYDWSLNDQATAHTARR